MTQSEFPLSQEQENKQRYTVAPVADRLLAFAIDALLFLGACVLAYLALRTPVLARARRLERGADVLFLTGLTLMVVVGALIAYEIV